jgi:hypothetical protein
MAVNGTGDAQYNRVFDVNGVNGKFPGNVIVGAQGQNLGYPASALPQKGGKRKSKKGGFWGQVLNQAVVPFGILGLQQSYRRGKRGGKKTRKHHK